MSSDFNARIEIGFLVLDHPAGNAAPIPIPAGTASRLAAIDDDAFVGRLPVGSSGCWPTTSTRLSDLAEKALALSPTRGSFSITWPTC